MSTATLDFNQPAQCQHSWGMRRCKKNYAAWQNASKMSESSYYSLHNLFHKMFVFQRGLRCCDNHECPALHQKPGDVFGWSLVRLFLTPSLLVRAGRLLRCPPGAGEQSGFGISHSLSSQGLWPSADSTANCSLIPSPLLFGQLWIFSCSESNSVRHATVQPDSVSRAVCSVWRENLTRTRPFISFTIRFFYIYGDKNWL